MLRVNASRLFLGGFSSGFSKGFSGGSASSGGGGGGSRPAGFSGGINFGNFGNLGGSGGSGGGSGGPAGGFPNMGNFFGGGGAGGGSGGPLGGFLDQALEWCSTSHAYDIAQRQGIHVKDIRFEKTPEGGVNVVVDAPGATPLQIEALGKQVQEECPVARFRKTTVSQPNQQMKWMRLPDKYDR